MNAYPGLTDNDPMTCKKASGIFSRLKMSIPIVKADYKFLVSYINQLASLRSGFYCTLCDADFQVQMNYYWENDANKSFYLGMSFCEKLTKIGLKFVKYMYGFFKIYIESASKLIQCKANVNGVHEDNERMIFEIPAEKFEDFSECQDGSNNKEGLFTCMKFCKNFDLTSISSMIDGDVPQLMKFVEYFKKMKTHFAYPTNNFLVNSVSDTEVLIEMNNETIDKGLVFFSSKIDSDEMNKHNTVIYNGVGVDLFEIASDNKYPLFIESQAILLTWSLMIFGLFFVMEA